MKIFKTFLFLLSALFLIQENCSATNFSVKNDTATYTITIKKSDASIKESTIVKAGSSRTCYDLAAFELIIKPNNGNDRTTALSIELPKYSSKTFNFTISRNKTIKDDKAEGAFTLKSDSDYKKHTFPSFVTSYARSPLVYSDSSRFSCQPAAEKDDSDSEESEESEEDEEDDEVTPPAKRGPQTRISASNAKLSKNSSSPLTSSSARISPVSAADILKLAKSSASSYKWSENYQASSSSSPAPAASSSLNFSRSTPQQKVTTIYCDKNLCHHDIFISSLGRDFSADMEMRNQEVYRSKNLNKVSRSIMIKFFKGSPKRYLVVKIDLPAELEKASLVELKILRCLEFTSGCKISMILEKNNSEIRVTAKSEYISLPLNFSDNAIFLKMHSSSEFCDYLILPAQPLPATAAPSGYAPAPLAPQTASSYFSSSYPSSHASNLPGPVLPSSLPMTQSVSPASTLLQINYHDYSLYLRTRDNGYAFSSANSTKNINAMRASDRLTLSLENTSHVSNLTITINIPNELKNYSLGKLSLIKTNGNNFKISMDLKNNLSQFQILSELTIEPVEIPVTTQKAFTIDVVKAQGIYRFVPLSLANDPVLEQVKKENGLFDEMIRYSLDKLPSAPKQLPSTTNDSNYDIEIGSASSLFGKTTKFNVDHNSRNQTTPTLKQMNEVTILEPLTQHPLATLLITLPKKPNDYQETPLTSVVINQNSAADTLSLILIFKSRSLTIENIKINYENKPEYQIAVDDSTAAEIIDDEE